MNVSRKRVAKLDCTLLDDLPSGAKPGLAVVLCHGVNAPAEDLVSIGGEALQLQPRLAGTTRFCLPAGPLDSADFGMPGGRAWWEIDWISFQRMAMSRDYSSMYAATPPGLKAAREALAALIETLENEWVLDASRVVIGGFSQGAMLATDVALHMTNPPAALSLFSGTMLNEAEWRKRASALKGVRVMQSHGLFDPVLPFAGAEKLRDLLKGAGAKVDFVPFKGEHGIGYEALEHFAQILASL